MIQIQENCTFQPAINRDFEITSSKYANAKTLTVTDRLYSDGMEKQKMKEMVGFLKRIQIISFIGEAYKK